MSNPLPLTVITSTYNKGERNRESIKSILNQSFKEFHYIVVNDGSSDNTKDILSEFNDSRLEIINQENRGFVKTMISTMRFVKTPYVAIQGAGDISLPNRLEVQLNFLMSRPDVGVVSSSITQMFSSELDINKKIKKLNRRNLSLTYDLTEYDKIEQMIEWNIVNHGEAMLRMSAYTEAGGYRSFFKYAQDRDLWLRILEKKSVVRIEKILYLKITDVNLDIYLSPRKIEKQMLLSLFANRLAYERLSTRSSAHDENLEEAFDIFINNFSPKEKKQILSRLYSRIRDSISDNVELPIDEVISIMEKYDSEHPAIKSLKRIKFIREKIPYGTNLHQMYRQFRSEIHKLKKRIIDFNASVFSN